MPVYLLETGKLSIDQELLTSFVRAGARGKIAFPADESSVFEEEIAAICSKLYLQKAAASLAAQRKMSYNFV